MQVHFLLTSITVCQPVFLLRNLIQNLKSEQKHHCNDDCRKDIYAHTPTYASDGCHNCTTFMDGQGISIYIVGCSTYKHQSCTPQEGKALDSTARVEYRDEHQYCTRQHDSGKHPVIVSLALIAYHFAAYAFLQLIIHITDHVWNAKPHGCEQEKTCP